MNEATPPFLVPTMSYAIGTKLSYDNGARCAVVIREDTVLVTKYNWQDIQEEMQLNHWMASMEKCPHGIKEMMVDLSDVITFPYRPLGTVLHATSPTHSQTAVVIKKGILVVKKMIHGEVFHPMSLFESEGEWRAYFPEEMTVTANVSDMSDPQKLIALEDNYNARTGCYSTSLNKCRLDSAKQTFAWAQNVGRETSHYEHDVKFWEKKCAEEDGVEYFQPYYTNKNRMYLVMDDTLQDITSFKNKQGEFIVDLKTNQAYKSFADIPGCLNAEGKPMLIAFYEDEYIGLTDQF